MTDHHEEGVESHHHYHSHPQTRYYYGYYGPYHQQMSGSTNDEELASEVKSALQWDSYVDAGKIDVSVQNGVVTLKGAVSNPREKRAAGDDAWDTLGVVDVHNDLEMA